MTLLRSLCALSLTLSAGSSFAQSDVLDANQISQESAKIEIKEDIKKEKSDEETSNKNIEKLEVTGSYVRRIDIEGPSPVVTFEKQDFENAGVDTVSDYLKESPLFGGSTDSGNRDGYFEFRGQHAGSTLILINGMRVPKLGGPSRGFYAGVEAIPTNIIDRVEILKDGSSALYGSDAMAGVMNFITKKDYDGAEYSVRVNIPEINKGLQQNHTLAFGKSYNRGSWFVSTQYVEQRGYNEANVGNYYNDPTVSASSNGSSTFFKTKDQLNGDRQDIELPCPPDATDGCEVDDRHLSYVREPRENIGTLLTGRYDINSDISLSFVGMYNRRKRMDLGVPNFINIDRKSGHELLDVNQFGSNELKLKSNGNNFAELNFSPISEVGGRQVEILQNSFSTQTKLEGYFLDSWSWNLSGSYAYSIEERNHQRGLVDLDGVRNLLYTTNYDVTNVAQNTGAFNSLNVQGIEAYEASLSTARFVSTGELFEMQDLYGAGGPVSIAFGTEAQWETTADAHDQSLIDANINQIIDENQKGSRTVTSFFTELVAYPLDALEVQLAGRLDNYSDFGDTLNPKVSIGWRPSNKVLFRTSWGTNFNAPSVRNMMQRNTDGSERFRINNDGDRRFIPTTRYRAADLRPEKGENYNFGVVVQPNKKWTFSVDQWNFHGKETIARLSPNAYTSLLESIGEAELEKIGATFTKDVEGNLTSARVPHVMNTGEKLISGLDFSIAFRSPIRLLGRVLRASAKMDHTHMFVRKVKSSPTAPFYHRRDLEWKNTMSFSLNSQNHGYRLAARTLAGDTDNRTQGDIMRTSTEYDFNYSYSIPWWTASFSLGVKNMFDTRPPVNRAGSYVDFSNGYNTYAFNALGRRYYVGYSQSF